MSEKYAFIEAANEVEEESKSWSKEMWSWVKSSQDYTEAMGRDDEYVNARYEKLRNKHK